MSTRALRHSVPLAVLPTRNWDCLLTQETSYTQET